MTEYYIRLKGQVRGPYTPSRLQQLARRGRFGRHYQVSLDAIHWEPAAEHPELFPAPPPPLPPGPRPGSSDTEGYELAEPGEAESEVRDDEIRDDEIIDDSSSGKDNQEEQQWHFSRGGNLEGPVPFGEILQLAANGQINANDFLWTYGMKEWVPAAEVSNVFPNNATYSASSRSTVGNGQPIRAAPMAVASLVLGLLGTNILFFLGSILAVVFGHVALKQIDASDNQLAGKSMAIAGLILGYTVLVAGVVVGAVICILLLRDLSGPAA